MVWLRLEVYLGSYRDIARSIFNPTPTQVSVTNQFNKFPFFSIKQQCLVWLHWASLCESFDWFQSQVSAVCFCLLPVQISLRFINCIFKCLRSSQQVQIGLPTLGLWVKRKFCSLNSIIFLPGYLDFIRNHDSFHCQFSVMKTIWDFWQPYARDLRTRCKLTSIIINSSYSLLNKGLPIFIKFYILTLMTTYTNKNSL